MAVHEMYEHVRKILKRKHKLELMEKKYLPLHNSIQLKEI